MWHALVAMQQTTRKSRGVVQETPSQLPTYPVQVPVLKTDIEPADRCLFSKKKPPGRSLNSFHLRKLNYKPGGVCVPLRFYYTSVRKTNKPCVLPLDDSDM